MREVNNVSEKEIKERVDFLASVKCNHTQHKYIDITEDLVQGTLLARIMYWFTADKNKKSKVRIFKDGYFWIAKQRKDWWEEIRITERQYDKAIKELEKKGFVKLAKYKFNSMPTIHIRPDFDNINSATTEWENRLREEIISDYESELQEKENGNCTKCNSGIDAECNSGITQEENLLTYTTNIDYNNRDYSTENTNRDLPTEKGENINKVNGKVKTCSFEKESMDTPRTRFEKYRSMKSEEESMIEQIRDICDSILEKEDADEICNTLEHYFERYTEKTGKIHPILKTETLIDIISKISEYSDTEYFHFERVIDDRGAFIKIIDEFFDGDFGQYTGQRTNWNLPHFMSDGVLDRLAQRLNERGYIQ